MNYTEMNKTLLFFISITKYVLNFGEERQWSEISLEKSTMNMTMRIGGLKVEQKNAKQRPKWIFENLFLYTLNKE